MDRRSVKFLVTLCKRMNRPIPAADDACAWMLLLRALEEMQTATIPDIVQAKAAALVILVQYGWRDVFKESLSSTGLFKSEEEAGRFGNCRA